MLTVGYVIKKLRKEQKITQEDLCEGICTASYLSRIENGDVNVSDNTINALLQRLGQDASRYLVFKTEKDLELNNQLYQLRRLYSLGQDNSHKQLLAELLIDYDSYDPTIQQFLRLHKFIDLTRDKYDPIEMKEFLLSALHLTKGSINLHNLSNQLFTQEEIMLLVNIANMIEEIGDVDLTLKILKALKNYLEDQRIAPEFIRRPYPIVLMHLGKTLGLNSNFFEAIHIAEKGIEYCINFDTLTILPSFLYSKGYNLGKCGFTSDAIRYVTQAYHVAIASNNQAKAQHYKNHLLVNYNLEI